MSRYLASFFYPPAYKPAQVLPPAALMYMIEEFQVRVEDQDLNYLSSICRSCSNPTRTCPKDSVMVAASEASGWT